MKKHFIIVSTAIVLMGILNGCASQSEAQLTDQTVSVKAQEVYTGSLNTEGTYIGVIENTESVELVSRVSGTVNEVNVSVGDTVSTGTVLARFDDTSARIDLAGAQTGAASAEKSLESAKKSLESAEGQRELCYL